MKRISILGSTGSIGTQTLEIVSENKDLEVVALTANENIDLLEKQIHQFKPQLAAVMDEKKALELKKRIGSKTEILAGMDGLIEAARISSADMVLTAVVGMIGLRPTVEAIKAGKDIALANKETLVTAGEIITSLVEAEGVRLLPVDSEHSAIFQALNGENPKAIESIILTASGGPFRGRKIEDLKEITKAQALKHPNWTMGHKITIDSATLVNKGLEVIEARWLFHAKPDQLKVLVHPQSIIHSMVSFKDSSVIAQLGLPDMKLPIQFALYFPERMHNLYTRLDLASIGSLTFEEPDLTTFRGLALAYDALNTGGLLPTVYNAANEMAVSLFLQDRISFLSIQDIIEQTMESYRASQPMSLEAVLEAERWAHEFIKKRW